MYKKEDSNYHNTPMSFDDVYWEAVKNRSQCKTLRRKSFWDTIINCLNKQIQSVRIQTCDSTKKGEKMNIKGMEKDMTCRGFKFEIGKEYKIDTNGKELVLCSDTVFHYCKSLSAIHKYYPVDGDNRYFEIEVLGEVVTDGIKYGSNHIKIIREIPKEELEELKMQPNNNNYGDFNTGNHNNGYFNVGDYNIGSHNSGNYNMGDCNTGNCNFGDFNTGKDNKGEYNTGRFNRGHHNTGGYNVGNFNTGRFNKGEYNSGCYNMGRYNSGFANKCDFSTGVFCNESDKNIRIFNQPSGMSLHDWYNSKYYRAIQSAPFILTDQSAPFILTDEEAWKIGGIN